MDPETQDNPDTNTEVSTPDDGGITESWNEFSDQYDQMEGTTDDVEAAATDQAADNEEGKVEDPAQAEAAPEKDPTDMSVDELKAWLDANPNNAKSYAHVHSAYTRKAQEHAALNKELEKYGGMETVQSALNEYVQLHQFLTANPDKAQALREMFSQQGQGQEQTPDGLQDDPLYQHLSPELQGIKQQLAQANQFIQTQQYQAQQQQAETMVDSGLNKAFSRYEQHFGEKPGKDVQKQIIQEMSSRKVYDNTDMLVDNLYVDKIMDKRVQDALKAQDAKARRNPSMKTVNSSAATEGPATGGMDPMEAFELALEQGGGLAN